MLFIRPLLRANRHRRHRAHTIVFFIFLVSQHRRKPDAARRPAAVPRVPARGRVLLDDVAPAPSDGVPDGACSRSISCSIRLLARERRRGSSVAGARRAEERSRADPRRGRVQPDAARRGRRHDPRFRGILASSLFRTPTARRAHSRSAPSTCRPGAGAQRRAGRARGPVPVPDPSRAPPERTSSPGRRSKRWRSSSWGSSSRWCPC